MEQEYEIIDNGDEFFHHIKLTDKKYKGIVYQYGAIKLIEENDTLRIKFEFEVFQNPNDIDTSTRAFNDHLGRILLENLQAETILGLAREQRIKDSDVV